MNKYPHVFRPLQLRGLTLKNRLFASPTSMDPTGPGETSYGPENYEYYMLRVAGVDMASPQPILDTIEEFRTTLEQIKPLL